MASWADICGRPTQNPVVRHNVRGTNPMLNAALAGLGLAYVPEDVVKPYVDEGALKRVLEDWCAPNSGYHLYYPSRRQSSPAFAVLVDALRYRK